MTVFADKYYTFYRIKVNCRIPTLSTFGFSLLLFDKHRVNIKFYSSKMLPQELLISK